MWGDDCAEPAASYLCTASWRSHASWVLKIPVPSASRIQAWCQILPLGVPGTLPPSPAILLSSGHCHQKHL